MAITNYTIDCTIFFGQKKDSNKYAMQAKEMKEMKENGV
jgi:hypothetical protein